MTTIPAIPSKAAPTGEVLPTPARDDAIPPGPFELAISKLPKHLLKSFSAPKDAEEVEVRPESPRSLASKSFDPLSTMTSSFAASLFLPFGTPDFNPRPSRRKSRSRTSCLNFTTFKKLPLELQLKVWNHAIADIEPRLVTLVPRSGKVPALYHTCQNSRKEIKKAFSTLLDLGLKLGQHNGFEALVRYETDTIFLKEMKYTVSLGNNPLSYAMEFYPQFLLPIKKLAVKMGRSTIYDMQLGFPKEIHFWNKLAVACPLLEEIVFDLEGLIWYAPNLSLQYSGKTAISTFEAALASGLKNEIGRGRFKDVAVFTITGLDGLRSESKKKWECVSKGAGNG